MPPSPSARTPVNAARMRIRQRQTVIRFSPSRAPRPGRSSGPGPACPPAPAGTPPAGGGAPAPSRCRREGAPACLAAPAPHPGSGRAPALQRGGAAMDAVIDRHTAGVDPRKHLDAHRSERNSARSSRSCATDSRSTPAHSRLNLARSIPFPHGTPWRCSCNVLIEMWDNQHESQTSPIKTSGIKPAKPAKPADRRFRFHGGSVMSSIGTAGAGPNRCTRDLLATKERLGEVCRLLALGPKR